MLGFENSEADLVIRFLCVPAIPHAIDPDEEQPIRDRLDGRPIRQDGDSRNAASCCTLFR